MYLASSVKYSTNRILKLPYCDSSVNFIVLYTLKEILTLNYLTIHTSLPKKQLHMTFNFDAGSDKNQGI